MHNRSNLPSRTTRRNHRENEQTRHAPSQMRRRRRAHRHLHRRNRPVVPMSSKPQRRSCQHHQSRRNSRRRSIPQRPRQRQKMHRVGARTMYAPGQNRNSYKAPRHPFHKNGADAPTPSGQRNPAQNSCLRGIIFIRSSRKSGLRIVLRRKKFRRFVKSRKHRKSAIRYNPKPHKKNHPLFVM